MHIVHVIVDIAYLHMSVSAVQYMHGVHVYASVLCTCMQNIVYASTNHILFYLHQHLHQTPNPPMSGGFLQAGLFNPWDRALYLSIKEERAFLNRAQTV